MFKYEMGRLQLAFKYQREMARVKKLLELVKDVISKEDH